MEVSSPCKDFKGESPMSSLPSEDCWHLEDSAANQIPPRVTDLALCGVNHFHTDQLLSIVASRLGSQLKRFAYSGFGRTVDIMGFSILAQSFKNLTSFALDSGEALDSNFVIQIVVSNCPNLVDVSSYDLNEVTLSYFIQYGIRLERFKHKRKRIEGLAVTDVTLSLLVRICPLLEELTLTDHTDGGGERPLVDISDTGLLFLTERAKTLRVLRLRLSAPQAKRCSAVAVMELASACTELVRLELSNFKRITDPPLYEIIQRCRFLEEINVDASPLSGTSLELLATAAHIRSISVKQCRKLTEQGFASLGQLSSLESLNAGHATGVTDISVSSICSRGRDSLLKSLVLNYGYLSDIALISISACPQMQVLALHNCPRVTNKGLKAIASGCPLLRQLSISGCEQVSDAGVISIASSCSQLMKIRLDCCRLISNPSVRALCGPGLRLRHLSMQGCLKLSDGLFTHLRETPFLRFVDLSRTRLTKDAMESYHKDRPLVEIIFDGLNFPFVTSQK